MTDNVSVVLAIDPGRSKCGVAVVRRSNAEPEVLSKCVAETRHLSALVKELYAEFSPEVIIIGNGTYSSNVLKSVENANIAPAMLVDEQYSTLLARERYFQENPPRGLRKLIPITLQTPPIAYDDYVAVILAERFINS